MSRGRKRAAHRVKGAAADLGRCAHCHTIFDRRRGAAAKGKSWFKSCEDCRQAVALMRKNQVKAVPAAAILRIVLSELVEQAEKTAAAPRTNIAQELRKMQQRQWDKPVQGRSLRRNRH